MLEVVASLTPILLADVLNPVLLTAMVMAAGTQRPALHSSALLVGHTLAYMVVGVVASYGLDALTQRLDNPKPIDYSISAVVGLGCLYAAFGSREGRAATPARELQTVTGFTCFSYGAFINFIGAPFALPYFAAVDVVNRSGLSIGDSWALLIVYNFAYALPFTLVPIAVALLGDGARPHLEAASNWLERIVERMAPWVLLGIGLWLIWIALDHFVKIMNP
ncbi:MAG: GAP family protein [Halieaceae bacterium]|nr:GAP family protein [Halieaceae bacterium]